MDLVKIVKLLGEHSPEKRERFLSFLEEESKEKVLALLRQGWELSSQGGYLPWLGDIVLFLGRFFGFALSLKGFRDSLGSWGSEEGNIFLCLLPRASSGQIQHLGRAMEEYLEQKGMRGKYFLLLVLLYPEEAELLSEEILQGEWCGRIKIISLDVLLRMAGRDNSSLYASLFLPPKTLYLDEIFDVVERTRESIFTPTPREVIAPRRLSRKGRFTPQREYEVPLLECLAEMEGRGKVREVLECVGRKMKERLTPEDRGRLKSGAVRWENSVMWLRLKLVQGGYLKGDSPRGIWELTRKGWERLRELKRGGNEGGIRNIFGNFEV